MATEPSELPLQAVLATHLLERAHAAARPAHADVGTGRVPEFSVGIMAYNEESNIAHAIGAILEQETASASLRELIVVASGCTDRTAEIVGEIGQRDARVQLIEQPRREGKASAINLFIGRARSPLLLMVSADVLVEQGTIDSLLSHFADAQVGMVGGHPIPVNDERSFLGHTVHLLWRLHDRLARVQPKLGEIVAFRNVVPSIPFDTAVDEISIQALVTQLGYRLVYEPEAVVFNRGPETVRDFLRQRRRIYAGHVRVRRQQDYEAATMSVRRIGRALIGSGSFSSVRSAIWTMGAIMLEALARLLGAIDAVRGRSHTIWEAVGTTKRDIVDGVSEGLQNVLVFHITDFKRHRLELGWRAGRRLTDELAGRIRTTLGPGTVVSIQGKDGTIVALFAGEREQAERAARRLIAEVAGANGAAERPSLALACGIISFSHTAQPIASSMAHPESSAVLASQES